MDIKKLLEFRKQKDWHWKNDDESPLTAEQKKKFKELAYYPPNPKLRFELSLDKNIPNVGTKVIVKTTGEDEQIYLKAGKIHFEVEGKRVEAVVLEDPQLEQYQYYLLFKDATTEISGFCMQYILPQISFLFILDISPACSPQAFSSFLIYQRSAIARALASQGDLLI